MQQLDKLERTVEAILFAGGEPVEIEKIARALDIDQRTTRSLIQRIRDRYSRQQSPLEVVTLDGACQLCTLPEYADAIRAALEMRRNTPLSPAALEVLAVIAYNQPVTRGFVDQVRGVDCSSILRGLADKGLVEEAGRLNVPGKPIAYRTTPHFLLTFGLDSLEQLPTLSELEPEVIDDADPPLDGQIDFFAGD